MDKAKLVSATAVASALTAFLLAVATPAAEAHRFSTARNCGTPDAPWCQASLPDNHAIWAATGVYVDLHPWGVNYQKIVRRINSGAACVRVGFWPDRAYSDKILVDIDKVAGVGYQYRFTGRYGDEAC